MATSNEQSQTVNSSAHPDRLTQAEAIDVIKQSKARPLVVAAGTPKEIGDYIKRYGNKQLTVVVLG